MEGYEASGDPLKIGAPRDHSYSITKFLRALLKNFAAPNFPKFLRLPKFTQKLVKEDCKW